MIWLVVTCGGATGSVLPITEASTLGREGGLTLPDSTVSRVHCELVPDDHGATVRDRNSRSGTLVDGQRINRPTPVRPGQTITVGDVDLLVCTPRRFHPAGTMDHLTWTDGTRTRVAALNSTSLIIGRDESCDVVVVSDDVSRRHCSVGSGPDRGWTVSDLGSTNGTFVDGKRVDGEVNATAGSTISLGDHGPRVTIAAAGRTNDEVTVRLADRTGTGRVHISAGDTDVASIVEHLDPTGRSTALVRLDDGTVFHPDDRWPSVGVRDGDTLMCVATPPPSSWTATMTIAAPAGHPVNQQPRTVLPPATEELKEPSPPQSLSWRGRGVFWQIVGGCGAMLAGLLFALIRPEYALFGLIAGVVGIVSIGASLLGEQSRRRIANHDYDVALQQSTVDLARIRRTARDGWTLTSPPLEGLEELASSGSLRLFERRPSDADFLRLRIGLGTRETPVSFATSAISDSAERQRFVSIREQHRLVENVPVLTPAARGTSIGICGPPSAAESLARRFIVEAALLHAPSDVPIFVLADDESYDWANWLPHCWSPAGTSRVTSSAAIATDRVEELARWQHDGQFPLVVVPEHTGRSATGPSPQLRLEHGVVVHTASDRRRLPSGCDVVIDVSTNLDAAVSGSYPDGPLGPVRCEALDADHAERLAISLARVTARPASSIERGLADSWETATDDEMARRWRSRAPGLALTIGTDPHRDEVEVDLVASGPHSMIAGTTGSGKSELLQTILTGLVSTNHPDDLSLFLIDFKGGAAFAPFAGLPHISGFVTDIEDDPRLASRAFIALDAEIERRKRVLEGAGVSDIRDLASGQVADMPRLVVVIDEFALLVKRESDIADRLDVVATQGRSLGVHLLLATQSPSGVITHAIRTNTNLWMCLRVTSDSESIELLGSRVAARLPTERPGAGFVRLGASESVTEIQVTSVNTPADATAAITVTRPGEIARPTDGDSTTVRDDLLGRVRRTTETLGAEAVRRLWLPPLPDELDPDDVPEPSAPDGHLAVPIGLVDQPALGTQVPLVVDLTAAGHALVAGVSGAGKSTALVTFGQQAARRLGPHQLHLYGLCPNVGSLAPLATLPHCGGVVSTADVEMVTGLFDVLETTIQRRRHIMGEEGIPTFRDWRLRGTTEPWVVVLFDDLTAFRETATQVESERLVDRFASLLSGGPAVGVHVMVGIHQPTDLRLREQTLFNHRIALAQADPADYSLVGLRLRHSDLDDLGPGRGLIPGGDSVQLMAPQPSVDTGPHTDGGPARLARLPADVALSSLPPNEPGRLTLGVGGQPPGPVTVAAGGGPLLITGAPGSGKSTLLAALRAQYDGPALLVTSADSPLLDARGERDLLATDPGEVAPLFAVAANERMAVFIDDPERLSAVHEATDGLADTISAGPGRNQLVAVAVKASAVCNSYEPWARLLVATRHAVLLDVSKEEGFTLGVRLPRIADAELPGRGVAKFGARLTVLQAARL